MEQMTLTKEEANAIRASRKYGFTLTPQKMYLLKICINMQESDDKKHLDLQMSS